TEQWFISMDEKGLRERALQEIKNVQWIPHWGRERISLMIENRPDWCISRQRLWGVPITVLYCEGCNAAIADAKFFAKVVDAFRADGADAWYERDAKEFLEPGQTCAKCGGAEFRKEFDILDVWFDSGCSHLAVLKRRPELTWPAAVYLEGHDQHRGWFHSSLLVGTGIESGAPYERVITCGFVVNEAGDKMSKSRGTGLSPQDVIAQSGADILRMWVAMVDYTDDIAFGPQILGRVGEAYRKIRNTARFLLANLSDFNPDADSVPFDEMEELDRWALARAQESFDRCRRAYEEFEFHVVYHRMIDLCTVDLSATYLDILKDRLYIEAPSSHSRRSAQTAMHEILRGLVAMLAPLIPYTADEIYELMPGKKEASVHLTEFPATTASLSAETRAAWDRIFALRETVSKVLETARGAGRIGQSLEADILLTGEFDLAKLTGGLKIDPSKIFIVSHVDLGPTSAESAIEPIAFEGIGKIGVAMKPARGTKCDRCWHYREEVRQAGDLCDRCAGIVEQLQIA
ncbi:MAG TPA: class I tRNA ligase family protein, partial [Thermoanaerobaculia bacterium]